MVRGIDGLGGEGFCDESIKALAIKSVTMEEGRGSKLSKITPCHLWMTLQEKNEK